MLLIKQQSGGRSEVHRRCKSKFVKFTWVGLVEFTEHYLQSFCEIDTYEKCFTKDFSYLNR